MAMTDDIASKVESIRRVSTDVDAREREVKHIKEQIKDIVESMPEFTAVDELTKELAEAKEKLRIALMAKANYNNLMERLGDEQNDLKDDRDVLSACVVDYYASTREHQIEIDSNGDAREVIVKGKLGKSEKYQPSLFGRNTEVTITDEQTSIV